VTKNRSNKSGIFIYGYYGMHNAGDDLLAKACTTKLMAQAGGRTFYLRNFDKVPIQINQKIILTNLEGMRSGHKSFFSKLKAFYQYFSSHQKIFKKCTHFVLGGGTLISGNSSVVTLLILATLIGMARYQKMECHALGLGLGPIHDGFKRRIAEYILRRFSSICLRDKMSLELSNSYAPNVPARLTADLAYSLPEYFLSPSAEKRQGKVIGLTLAGPHLQRNKNSVLKEHVIKELLQALNVLLDKGYSLTCISLQELDVPDGPLASDSVVFSELLNYLPKEKVEIKHLDISSKHVHHCYSNIDLMLGMRLHGAILAGMQRTPFVGFSHDHKLKETCIQYEMPFSQLEELSADWLINSVEAALKKKIPIETNEQLARLSASNFDFIFKPSLPHS